MLHVKATSGSMVASAALCCLRFISLLTCLNLNFDSKLQTAVSVCKIVQLMPPVLISYLQTFMQRRTMNMPSSNWLKA